MLSDCYKDVTYLLDEDSYADSEYQDLVRKRFIKQWEGLMEPYKDTFTASNYQLIFGLTINVLARLWETQILNRSSPNNKLTELGALKFDRDLRSIVNYLSNQTSYGVAVLRDNFSRLQQIATLLSVESVSQMY